MAHSAAILTRFTALFSLALASAATAQPVPADHASKMAAGLELFKSQVQQILVDNCVKCHGGKSTKGDLDLTTRELLLVGGENGKVIVPGDASASRLMKMVRHEEEPHMPEKADKLPEEAIAQLAAWIDAGAPYAKPLIEDNGQRPKGIGVTDEDRKFWSFLPLKRVEPPAVQDATWAKNAIDPFILAKLEEKKLSPTPPADRRRLIRRATLDLLGIPPTPEEIEAFVNDASPDAYEKLIDRLLASPHYGERWGRHWLDLARFAESHGYEQDYDRPYAYHYRDFVIQALNDDLPYDTFVKWQIAGDEIDPKNPMAMKATGYLGAGTHATQITASQAEKERYDELDDKAATIGTSMLGLTIGCARCHDHKFDPILATDYYRFISTFTTTVRSDMEIDLAPEKTAVALAQWEKEHAPLVAALAAYEESELPGKLDAWLAAGNRPEQPKWVVLDPVEIKSTGGATFTKLPDGSHLVSGNNADFDTYTVVVHTKLTGITAIRLDAMTDASFPAGGPGRADNGNIDLTNFTVTAVPLDGQGLPPEQIALSNPVATFEQGPHLAAALAIDGDPKSGWALDPQFGKDHAILFQTAPFGHANGTVLTFTLDHQGNNRHNIGRLRLSLTTAPPPVALDGDTGSALLTDVLRILDIDPAQRTEADQKTLLEWYRTTDPQWQALNQPVQESLARKPQPQLTKVMVCSEGVPAIRLHTQGPDFYEQTFFLKRGDLEQKDGVAPQGFPIVLMRAPEGEKRWLVEPPPGSRTSMRRTGLANWITDVEFGAGHLLARVMANRLWHYHFGRGIVATPSDFGSTGERPTHPELLDYLATELIQNNWRLKPLHKLIMTSAAYRQDSTFNEKNGTADPDNKLLWRYPIRRLEGEAIRDSILAVTGSLDRTMFGPGSLDEAMRRRSIYFTIKRSQMIPIMTTFDWPDSLQSLGRRSTTTVAPQALALMNNPHVLSWAQNLAKQLMPQSNDRPAIEGAIRQAYVRVLGRQPTGDEVNDAASFVEQQAKAYEAGGSGNAVELALSDFCQALLSLNEFVFVE